MASGSELLTMLMNKPLRPPKAALNEVLAAARAATIAVLSAFGRSNADPGLNLEDE